MNDDRPRLNGPAVEYALARMHMSKQSCAQILGVSPSYLSKLIGGDRVAQPEHIETLSQLLGMSPALLLGRTELSRWKPEVAA